MILVIRKMIGELNSTGRLYMYIYSMCDLFLYSSILTGHLYFASSQTFGYF